MEIILIVVVALHLLAVNLAGAGPLLAAWIDWRGSRLNRPELQQDAWQLVLWSMMAAAIGTAIGFVAFAELLYWPQQSQQSFGSMLRESISTARWWFIGSEIVFYLACTLAAVWLWNRPDCRRWMPRVFAVAAGTNLLYHFPPLFTILAIKFERHIWTGEITHQEYLQLMLESETIARVLHVWLASFAVAGLTLSWIGWRLHRPIAANASNAGQIIGKQPTTVSAIGGRWALWATMLQIPVGVWVLFALPDVQGQHVMMGNPLFITALVAALALMHQLAMLSLGKTSLRSLSTATALMVIVVTLMMAALECSRPL